METREDLRLIKGKRTKDSILGAALEVLSEVGIQGFSASKLAARAGVSKSNLFHHFKNVDDIPFELLESMIKQFGVIMSERKYKTVYDFVYNVGRPVIEASDEQAKFSIAFFQFYQISLVNEKYRARTNHAINLIAKQFQEGLEQILKRPLSVDQKAAIPLLMAMAMDGMGLYRLILKDKTQLLKVWRTFAKLIGDYIEK